MCTQGSWIMLLPSWRCVSSSSNHIVTLMQRFIEPGSIDCGERQQPHYTYVAVVCTDVVCEDRIFSGSCSHVCAYSRWTHVVWIILEQHLPLQSCPHYVHSLPPNGHQNAMWVSTFLPPMKNPTMKENSFNPHKTHLWCLRREGMKRCMLSFVLFTAGFKHQKTQMTQWQRDGYLQ